MRRASAAATGALGVGLLVYVVVRAATLPILFDEAFTALSYVRAPWRWLFDPLHSPLLLDANNHFLNTDLAKIAASAFGMTPLALRLPNLAAFAVFASCCAILFRRLASPAAALAGFIAVVVNPYALDLFSACRGYGLSLGLMLPSMLLLSRRLDTSGGPSLLDGAIGLLLALAAVACPVNLPLAAAIGGVAALRRLWLRGPGDARPTLRELARDAAPYAASAILLAAAIGPEIVALRRAGGFYWGATHGWRDTVRSIVRAVLYLQEPPAWRVVLATAVGAAAMALIAASAMRALWRERRPGAERLAGALSLALVLWVGVISAACWLMDVKHPVDRMVLAPVVLLLLTVSLILAAASESPRRPRVRLVGWGALAVLATLTLANGSATLRVRYSYHWLFDLDTPQMLQDLTEARPLKQGGGPVRLGISPVLMPAIDFYRVEGGMRWLAPMNQTGPHREDDFLYLRPGDVGRGEARGCRMLKSYATTGNVLCVQDHRAAPAPAARIGG